MLLLATFQKETVSVTSLSPKNKNSLSVFKSFISKSLLKTKFNQWSIHFHQPLLGVFTLTDTHPHTHIVVHTHTHTHTHTHIHTHTHTYTYTYTHTHTHTHMYTLTHTASDMWGSCFNQISESFHSIHSVYTHTHTHTHTHIHRHRPTHTNTYTYQYYIWYVELLF